MCMRRYRVDVSAAAVYEQWTNLTLDGKYQGTWIPLQRGRELAAQFGVDSFVAPIFDFNPSQGDVAALPLQRDPSDRGGRKKTPVAAKGFTPGLTPSRVASPYQSQPLPPQFAPPEGMIMQAHPSALAYPSGMYYAQGPPPPGPESHSHSLAPSAPIGSIGLPPGNTPYYLDQYGQPHPVMMAEPFPNGDVEPPAKRARTNGAVENEVEDEVVSWEDEDEDDEPSPGSLPVNFRLSSKPARPKQSAAHMRIRNKLLSVFQTDEQFDLREVLGLPVAVGDSEDKPDIDIDMVIDDLGHTALHWAAATAKPDIVRQLIELGADIHRGNYAGETPLIRSVLTNNLSERGGLSETLTHLGPSIRTLDHSYRSVLHHIALIAGVKGRGACARQYMTGVLEFVARDSTQAQTAGETNGGATGQMFKNLLDVQDSFGDTALNLAARVGNVPLIKLLLDAGADKTRENKHGLKPVDYGLEVDALRVSPGEGVVAALKTEVHKPERHSRDVQKSEYERSSA